MNGIKKEIGWVVHYVFGDDKYPNSTNAHTHGFETKYKHLNIQICLNIDPQIVNSIFWGISRLLDSGKKFSPEKKYANIIEDMNVMFAYAKSNNELVLRLILPDEKGNLRSEMKIFKEQWDGVIPHLT